MTPRFLDIPPGTPATRCGSEKCGQLIYWISHPASGRPHPVDPDVDGGVAPTADAPGRGVSHFATCADAALFRKSR
jgi:hypothetical protein